MAVSVHTYFDGWNRGAMPKGWAQPLITDKPFNVQFIDKKIVEYGLVSGRPFELPPSKFRYYLGKLWEILKK